RSLHRLDYDGCEAIRNVFNELCRGLEVIIGRDEYRAAYRARNARWVRPCNGIVGAVRGIKPVQRVIVMAMICALELEHEIAAGKRASKAERIERCLRSVPYEFHCFRARHHIGDACSKAWRDVVHGVKSGAARSLLPNGGYYARMPVTNHHWPRPEHKI